MAIFGAGSKWDEIEKKEDFFGNENFEIGWNYSDAKDLYYAVSSIKVGDIIYLKANKVGSKIIRIKGIGIVKQTIIHAFMEKEVDIENFSIKIKWIVKDEFHIEIPQTEGKLTNVRAATFYEEFLPFVQTEILNKLFN